MKKSLILLSFTTFFLGGGLCSFLLTWYLKPSHFDSNGKNDSCIKLKEESESLRGELKELRKELDDLKMKNDDQRIENERLQNELKTEDIDSSSGQDFWEMDWVNYEYTEGGWFKLSQDNERLRFANAKLEERGDYLEQKLNELKK